MQLYNIALFIHMLGLVILFAAFALYLRAGARLRTAMSLEQVRSWLGLLESTNPMFPAGLVLLLASGIFMMVTRWRSAQPWIVVGLAGLVAITVIGGIVSSRQLRTIRAAVDSAQQSISADLERAISFRAPWLVTTALNGGAVGILWVMTVKPGWAGSIAAVAIGATFGAVVEAMAAPAPRAAAARHR